VKNEKVVTLLLIGFGILGIVYYLGKKKTVPGALGNAGGGGITPAVRSASAGVSGSIPNIIASAAALTGQTFGSIFSRSEQAAGIAPKPGTIEQSSFDPGNTLVDPTSASGVSGPTQFVSLESGGTVSLPGLADFGPDIAGQVSALDVGGLDYGTLSV
jgi:hypothetical protein